MGNTSQLDDPKSEVPGEASADVANGTDPANGNEVAERPDPLAPDDAKRAEPSDEGSEDLSRANAKSSPSLPPSDARPASRRSSLRPAPPSFKPSTRDPSQLLRPAMVVHAGDVDADVPLWDIAEPAPSQPSQAAWDAPRPEPFALADDFSPNGLPTMAAVAPATEAPKEPTAVTVTVSDNHAPSVKSTRPQRAGRNTLSHFGAPNRQSKPHHAVPAHSPADEPPKRAESRSKPPGRRLPNGHVAAIAAAVLLAGVIVAMMVGRTNAPTTSEPSASTARSEQVFPAEVHPSVTAATPVAAADSVASAAATAEGAEAQAAVPSASSTPTAAASADAVDPNATRVTLEVVPADARVIQQGRLQPPPYVFDVPKGKKISLELARFGFVTQKVVLDGKKPLVKIGLRRVPNLRGAID